MNGNYISIGIVSEQLPEFDFQNFIVAIKQRDVLWDLLSYGRDQQYKFHFPSIWNKHAVNLVYELDQ